MKVKYVTWLLAVALVVSACGDKNDADHFNVKDPLLEDDGKNDVGS